jgi:hypothetical protein
MGDVILVFAPLLIAALLAVILVWKTRSTGAKLGAAWGFGGLFLYVALMNMAAQTSGGAVLLSLVKVFAFPSWIWGSLAYRLAGGGTMYHNPAVVLVFSVLIGASIGYAAEKIYRRKEELRRLWKENPAVFFLLALPLVGYLEAGLPGLAMSLLVIPIIIWGLRKAKGK